MRVLDYDEIDAVNWSTLKWLGVSPKHYQWHLENRIDKPAFALGRAVHLCALEPEKFGAHYATYDGRRGTNAHKAWLAEHPGVTDLKPAEMANIQATAGALRTDKRAAAALSGAIEYIIEWVDETSGTKCKARVDCAGNYITDLKTARDITKREFARAFTSYEYYGQMAYYHDGAIAAKKIPADAKAPLIIAQEKTGPYDTATYRMSPDALEIGRSYYRKLLRLRADCVATDWWPGAQPDEEQIDVLWLPKVLQTEDTEEEF